MAFGWVGKLLDVNLTTGQIRTRIDAAGYSRLLDECYAARGWDLEFGWPHNRVLKTLSLEEVGAELDACRDAVFNAA